MKTIITASQMRDADRHTIERTAVASIDLMESAAAAFLTVFMQLYPDKHTAILVCCGTGNNGGDGLAVARLLQTHGYDTVAVWIARFSGKESDDFTENLARLRHTPVPITELSQTGRFPAIAQDVIIDALLGSGLNKPLAGAWLRLAQHLNDAPIKTVAIDIPSGLRADGIMPGNEYTVSADEVITFQRPKLSFFFPESSHAVKRFHVVDIGLDENFIEQLASDYRLTGSGDIKGSYRSRGSFSHKGTYGHALVVAGSTETMGAAILACGASVYSGAGRTSASVPPEGLTALNTRYPEVMYCSWESLPEMWDRFNAVAIGPGLGPAASRLQVLLSYRPKPFVLDADALTYIGEHPELLRALPPHSILTPHMKEFDRLFGQHTSWYDRTQTARTQAAALNIIIILKNRYTFIALPDGRVIINPTGNPAMAGGGMGDVLTGILVSLLAQGYTPQEAAIMGCYLHGLAGDRLTKGGMAVTPATQVIGELPYTINRLTEGLSPHLPVSDG